MKPITTVVLGDSEVKYASYDSDLQVSIAENLLVIELIFLTHNHIIFLETGQV